MTFSREVRAVFDDDSVTVYQAYPPSIAVPAAANGSLIDTPFKLTRMTWIKPSFLWMMYRSGWATKPGQEHILRIRLSRSGFEKALGEACLSQFDPAIHADRQNWKSEMRASDVRVQWDPERNTRLEPLPQRAIQVGLAADATRRYVKEWTLELVDITDYVRRVAQAPHDSVALPAERRYPLPPHIAANIGASGQPLASTVRG